MLVDYNTLPNTARIWIYQSDRKFMANELEIIKKEGADFVNNWTRHGDHLKGSFTILYNQFLVLAIDESFANASGCSIDSSVRFVKKIESQLSIDLMNKLNISFKDGENINIVSLAEFQNYVKEGEITAETIVFNNMVKTKGEIELKWEVPAKDSWHQKFLN
ncbi:ABC transporter ATPase [Flavicella sp.]|uniref:ABC transporter ATPase n=1 Tax=Flavicella sp. TaxID=2957742 RepID=UPI0030159DF5